MELVLSNLNIGFNCDVKVIEQNVFEITGDEITIDDKENGPMYLSKLTAIYHHEGLLDYAYNGQEVPDNGRLFHDIETRVNSSWGGEIIVHHDMDPQCIRLTEDNSIEVYTDLSMYDYD